MMKLVRSMTTFPPSRDVMWNEWTLRKKSFAAIKWENSWLHRYNLSGFLMMKCVNRYDNAPPSTIHPSSLEYTAEAWTGKA